MLSVSSLSAVLDNGLVSRQSFMNGGKGDKLDGERAAVEDFLRPIRHSSRTASLLTKPAPLSSALTSNPRRNHRIPASDGSSVALYKWPQPNGPVCLLQHQLVDFLGFKSFKRKYNTGLTRRKLDAKEHLFLVSKRLLSEAEQSELTCAVVLLAEEVLSLLRHEFPKHYQILEKRVTSLSHEGTRGRSLEAAAAGTPCQSANNKCLRKAEKPIYDTKNHLNHRHEKQVTVLPAGDALFEESDSHLVSASSFNSSLRMRRERQCKCLNLQTMQVNYPRHKQYVADPAATRIGAYPVPLVQGQFFDGFVRRYTSAELFRLPFNTVILDQANSSKADAEAKPSEAAQKGTDSDVCATCQRAVNSRDERSYAIRCSTCNSVSHIKCLEMDDEMLKVALTYDWQCINCKICSKCSQSSDEEMMMFCDRCDRGFHTYCVGLDSIPEGSWTCRPCLQAMSDGKKSGKHSSDPPDQRSDRKRQRTADSSSSGSVKPSEGPVEGNRHSLRLLKKRTSRRDARRRRRL